MSKLITERKQLIIDHCLVEILKAARDKDFSAVDELLSFIPEEYLLGFMPEEGYEIDFNAPSPWDEKEIENNGSPFNIISETI